MAAFDDLIQSLRATRKDYDEEVRWHRFLLDAAFGTGGFRGKIGATSISHLGWAAEAYAQINSLGSEFTSYAGRHTYLDQFAREDAEKFERRIDVAHYTNYVGPIHDLLLSYISKQDVTRDAVPERLDAWLLDVDGKGQPWPAFMRSTVRPRASLLGWCPVLFDSPDVDVAGPVSLARQRELGLRTRALALFPVNVLDVIADDDGELEAVKIRTDHWTRDSLLDQPIKQERYALWYRDRVERYTITHEKSGPERVERLGATAHRFGQVPLAVFRAKPTPEDRLRGISSIANSAVTARRLFNLESEMDDHLRGQVFAVMGVPVQDVRADIGEIIAGNSSALKVPMQSNMPIHFAAPPASVALSLEKRMEVLVREIYRTENVEHAKSTGTTSASGVARAYEFEQTNRRLSGMAQSLARDEERALRIAGEIQSIDGSGLITVTAPTDYSVEDVSAEIEATLASFGLKLGVTAEFEMRKRLVARLLPNLPSATEEQIFAELEEIRQQGEQDAAALDEVDAARVARGADGATLATEEPDEGEEAGE